MSLIFDHIILGCLDLDAGAAALSDRFGAPPAGRGVHAMMGTHNALWNMGDAYLELVAIDPDAPHPGRPRWFGLDEAATMDRLADGPRLLTWAASGPGAEALAQSAPEPIGEMETFSRDDLRWRVAIPTSGAPALDGLFPLTIEWLSGLHPAKRLGDQGLRCAALDLSHPEIDLLRSRIEAIGAPLAAREGPAQIEAKIDAPNGPVAFRAFD